MRPLSIILLAACLVGCHSSGSTTSTAASDQALVQGDWKLVALKGTESPSGHLQLNSDGTFAGEMPRKSGSAQVDKFTGRYSVTRESVEDRSVLFVDFALANGKASNASMEADFRLAYDPKNKVLNDLLTMGFCRPEDFQKVKQMFDKQRAARR